MAFFDDKENTVVVDGQTDNVTNRTDWQYVGEGNAYRVRCTVLNFTGDGSVAETSPVLNWSIQHTDNPFATPPTDVTDLIASGSFDTVELTTALPNAQIKQIGMSGGPPVSKAFIRAVWNLGGLLPRATVKFEASKLDFSGPGLVRVGGTVGQDF